MATTQKEKLNRIMKKWEKGDITNDEVQFMFRQAFRYIELCENGEPKQLNDIFEKNCEYRNQLSEVQKIINDFEYNLIGDISIDYVIYRLKRIIKGETA